ncbi:MAG: hypothetical protein QM804_11405 [Propionicimonas sp.]
MSMNAELLHDVFRATYEEQGWRALMSAIHWAVETQGDLPENLRPAVDEAISIWRSDAPDLERLTAIKVAIWEALEAKNGDSITIEDAVDRTLRACLCLVEVEGENDIGDLMGWAAEMLSSQPWPRMMRFF